jgi:arsenite-transporting ATPase
MAFEDENSALILLASADRYSALHQWLQELLDIQQENFDIRLVNLSGEFNLDISDFTAKNNFIAESFNHLSSLARLWEQLNPHAKEWWQLLDIATKQSIELPQLPGVEDLTRLIFLSEILDREPESTLIIVILPAPLHALKLLDMAQQGPALIDQLLEPLLNWWDTTRQTLSTVEKLLRLRLPSSQQLRLNEIWKGRLHLLER